MLNGNMSAIVLIAALVEALTEIIKKVLPFLKADYLPAVSAVLGIILCITTQTGILEMVQTAVHIPILDYILTGILISRGSGIIHDIIDLTHNYARRLKA